MQLKWTVCKLPRKHVSSCHTYIPDTRCIVEISYSLIAIELPIEKIFTGAEELLKVELLIIKNTPS